MSPNKLITIHRDLVVADHETLRRHIPEVNHSLPNLQIKWRRLGEASLTLIEARQFQRAADNPRGKLHAANPEKLAEAITEQIIPRMPTEKMDITPSIIGIDYLGSGRIVSIAYLLEPTQLTAERLRFTSLLDRLNGINTYWGDFKPHLSIATIDNLNANQEVLDIFSSIAPPVFRFLPAEAKAE